MIIPPNNIMHRYIKNPMPSEKVFINDMKASWRPVMLRMMEVNPIAKSTNPNNAPKGFFLMNYIVAMYTKFITGFGSLSCRVLIN